MNWNDLQLRLRALFLRRRVESDLQEELAGHLELQIRKYMQFGLAPDQAKLRARLDFGSFENTKEACRDARRVTFFSQIAQDLRYAINTFLRTPGFTALIIFMLALGMGASLATFSVMDAIVLRLLPVKDPASLFRTVRANQTADDSGGDGASYVLYQQMQKRTAPFADLMAYRLASQSPVSIAAAEPNRLTQQSVSGNYFQVLGVEPVIGRMLSPQDDTAAGQHAVAVISNRLWKTKFDSSQRAIGSKLLFDNHIFDIVGIAPPAFFGVEVGKIVDVWTPISMLPPATLSDPHSFWLRIMGRLHSGVPLAQATAPMQSVMNEAMLEDVRLHAPPGTPASVINQFLAGMRIKAVPAGGGISSLRGQYKLPLQIMLAVVALVLLIACSNVANLLIAKGTARQRETAIRLSLGAGRSRILQQLITESLVLSLLSVTVSWFLARSATPALVRLLAPSNEQLNLAIGVDLRLLAFTSILILSTVLICGLLPAIRLALTDIYSSLRSGSHLTTSRGSRLRKALVASQVALSLVLVVAAVLFSRTLVNLLSSDLGFNPTSVLVSQITLKQTTQNPSLAWNDLLQHARSLPGVEQASLSSDSLFAGPPQLLGIRTTAAKVVPPDPVTGLLFVSQGYFQTLSISTVNGREFESHDNDPANPIVAIVNESFVRKFFGNENPLERKLTKLANAPVWAQIVGIVRDAKFSNLRENPPPMLYVPYGRIAEWLPPQAHPGESFFLETRGHQSPSSLAADLPHEFALHFTIGDTYRQQQIINDTLVRERLLASVADVFGILALLLAVLGLYGIMTYAVVQRRPELGVRAALGASPTDIIGLMLRESAWVVGAGTLAGILAAIFAARLTRTQLFGLAPNDPTTFIFASIILLVASLVAASVPAYRAARADPMIALRHE